jgi:ribulose-5-phosphate 4-epimerase/fuculose-1-phosphate aldolase
MSKHAFRFAFVSANAAFGLGRVSRRIPAFNVIASAVHSRLHATTSNIIPGRKERLGFLHRRFLGQIADSEPTKLQELPDQRFWTGVFDELRSNYPAETIEGAKVEKWIKMPRDHVKKGEFVVDLDVAGMIISLRAESVGYVGAHLVKEGALLEKGMVATNIYSEPEPLPSISDAEMSKAMMGAEGSVSNFKERLHNIEEERSKVLEDFVATCRLATLQGLSESSTDLIVAQVPGQSDNVFAPLSGLFGSEVSRDKVVEVNMESGTVVGFATGKDKRSNAVVDANGIRLLGAILHARPAWNCILKIALPYTSVLAAAGGASGERIRAAIGFPEAMSHDVGVALSDLQAEGERLSKVMGNSKILLSREYGVIIANETLVCPHKVHV